MSSGLNARFFFAGSTNFCMEHAASRMQSHQRTEAASVNYDGCSNEGVAKQKFSFSRTVAVHVRNKSLSIS